MMHPLVGISIVLGSLTGLLGVLTLYRHLGAPHPEILRKCLHVGMGAVTLSFPWLFDQPWPVLVLCGLSVALLIALRTVKVLKSNVGQVVNSVSRASFGDIYFPLAVCVLWMLYLRDTDQKPAHRLLSYLIPLLLLALSDAFAALVGVAYGRLRYATPDGVKSLEGSFAFFLCSFVCAHIPILLMTDCGRAETLLIALLLAWLATLFESISWSGLDNLILPIAAYLMLQVYWPLAASALVARLIVIFALTVFALALYRWTPIRGSAVFGCALLGYIFWTLGGRHWLISPLLLFTASAVLSLRYPATKDKTLNAYAVVSVTSAGLLWLFLSQVRDGRDWCYPSTVSFGAHLGMVMLGRLRLAHPSASPWVLFGVCAGGGALLMMTPYVLFHGTEAAVHQSVLALPLVALAVTAFAGVQPDMHDCPFDTARWVRQAICAALVSLVAAGFLLL